MTLFRDRYSNLGAYVETTDGARVVVVGHDAARTGAQDDTYDLVDLDTGRESMRAGYQWAGREIQLPRMTRFTFQTWTGFKWATVRRVDGIGDALKHAARWAALGFDVRVTCGAVVIDEQRGVVSKVA